MAVSTRNQARSALLFLYQEVLLVELPWLEGVTQNRVTMLPRLSAIAQLGRQPVDGEPHATACRCVSARPRDQEPVGPRPKIPGSRSKQLISNQSLGESDFRGCERLEHDQCIDEPKALMAESARKPADHGEAVLLPKANGSFVCGDDEIELHGAKAHGDRLRLRVLAHCRGDALAPGFGSHDVAAVADVRTQAGMIGLDEICAHNVA